MRAVHGRRDFLKGAAAVGATAALCQGSRRVDSRKLVVVLFGGGTRNSESIDESGHRYIPRLWNSMVPQGTLFTNMLVDHKVVHPNSTGSIKTGHWEWDDIDWSRPVANPTIFEMHRKAHKASDLSAWAFVYASILAKTGESTASGFGRDYAANVVEPPTIPRSTATRMDRIMYEAGSAGTQREEREASRRCAQLARTTSRINMSGLRSKSARAFMDSQYAQWKRGEGSTSHDLFLADRAIACMKKFAPDVISVDFGEIDCAHYGSWSRYVDAIRRTDELTWRLWETVNSLPAYRNNTLMLVLPDHGRELDESGGWGFIHHSDFYTDKGADEGCRKVWMLALGPSIRQGAKIDKQVPVTAAASTGLEFLGLDASRGAAESVMGDMC